MKHLMLAGMLLASSLSAYGSMSSGHSGYGNSGRYDTYKIHTDNVKRHASGLEIAKPVKPAKLKTGKAPKAREHKEHIRKPVDLMRELGYYR